ncbi:MAG: phytoene desaturase family protein, partial [Candidatus Nanoarchaeia archaeon]
MTYDYIVIGTGMGGLTIAALLANKGFKVLSLEAHEYPGGMAHTFPMAKYKFCAQVHYIMRCGKGQIIDRILNKLNLNVGFIQLDPEGYDVTCIGKHRYPICKGLPKYQERLIEWFPAEEKAIKKYIDIITKLYNEIESLPEKLTIKDYIRAPFNFPTLIKYQNYTVQKLYNKLRISQRLQAVLAGQGGDYMLPPNEASLLAHVGIAAGYDNGSYYPKKHFHYFVEQMVNAIKKDGCDVLFEHEVTKIIVENGITKGVKTKNGKTFKAKNVIANVDPKVVAKLIGKENLTRDFKKKINYKYCHSIYNVYFAVKGLDLRKHGFGSWNIWHHGHDDVNKLYDEMYNEHDYSNPLLFMSTPTLHTDEPGLAPEGHHIIQAVTGCDYDYFKHLKDTDKHKYNIEKTKIKNQLINVIEKYYIPKFRNHIVMAIAGTPTTTEHFVW